jgi:hypothetical protein
MYKLFFIATVALAQPVNVVITDSSGNVYLAENQGRIRRVGTNGIITTVAGMVGVGSGGDGGPAVQAGLNVPLGLAVESTGNFLYISDYQNCRIRRVTLSTGIIITFAGTGTCVASPDGSAGSTSFYYPTALVMDSQGRLVVAEPSNADSRGNIYLADLLNHRIRVLSPPGTTPFITSIDTAGGFQDIAQNSWTEIKGANLGPPTEECRRRSPTSA